MRTFYIYNCSTNDNYNLFIIYQKNGFLPTKTSFILNNKFAETNRFFFCQHSNEYVSLFLNVAKEPINLNSK